MARTKQLSDLIKPHELKETYNLTPHPKTGRMIDNHPGIRTKPMRVLVLGASRTGTMSMYSALETLGYTPYHMAKAVQAPKSNLNVWAEGLEAKYQGEGKPFGRAEFDKILGNFDACCDVPCIAFAEELIEAYPEAKIVITTRDAEKWLHSMQTTAGRVLGWRSWEWLAPWDKALSEPFWRHANALMPNFFGTMTDWSVNGPAHKRFVEHYELVRRCSPPERTLDHYQVSDGWGPLCEFLGHDVPQENFPRMNDATQFIMAHRAMYVIALSKFVLKISVFAAPLLAIGALTWWEPDRWQRLW